MVCVSTERDELGVSMDWFFVVLFSVLSVCVWHDYGTGNILFYLVLLAAIALFANALVSTAEFLQSRNRK